MQRSYGPSERSSNGRHVKMLDAGEASPGRWRFKTAFSTLREFFTEISCFDNVHEFREVEV